MHWICFCGRVLLLLSVLVVAWLQSCLPESGECVRTWCWLLQTSLAFSFPDPIPPCALSTVDEKGGQGWWDSQEALPPEKLLESSSVQLCFMPLDSLPWLFVFLYPSTFLSNCLLSPFPLSRASVLRVLVFLLYHIKLTGAGPGQHVTVGFPILSYEKIAQVSKGAL